MTETVMRKEAVRDQVESAFTPLLRRLREAVPHVLAAVFVDREGECIDYVSALDPYDAKVAAAHMLMLVHALVNSREKCGVGEPTVLEIVADEREMWSQRVGDDYVLVVVLSPGFDRVELRQALTRGSNEFRQEVGIDAPSWDSVGQHLSVRVRPSAVGWEYAPKEFTKEAERKRVVISDVLGRWTEETAKGEELICFRVRTDDGRELTLVHDPDIDGWMERD